MSKNRIYGPIIVDTIEGSDGNLAIDTGSTLNTGSISIGHFAQTIEIGGGTGSLAAVSIGAGSTTTTVQSPLTAVTTFMALGNVYLGNSPGHILSIAGNITGSLAFSNAGQTNIFKNPGTNGGPGNALNYTGAAGSDGYTGMYNGGTGGTTNFTSGKGGDGTTTQLAGAGGDLNIAAGDAGADGYVSHGGGNIGGSININAGQRGGIDGYGFYDGYINIGTVRGERINLGTSGKQVNVNTYFNVFGPSAFNHNVYLGDDPGKLIFFNGTAVTSLIFGQGGAPGIFQQQAYGGNGNRFQLSSGGGQDGYAGGAGTNAGNLELSSGQGGAAFSSFNAGNAGGITLTAGPGGAGSSGGVAGEGGPITLTAGNAGADNGGGGGNGGSIFAQAGNASGTGTTGGGIIIDGGTGSASNGGVSIGATNAVGIILGNDSTYITTYAAIFAFGASQDHALVVGTSGPDVNGKTLYINGGMGGIASATQGGTGGLMSVTGGPAGDGTATKPAGIGGNLLLTGGIAGGDFGGGGNNGGNLIIDGGLKSGAGIDGYIKIGTNTAYEIDIGISSAPVYMTGSLLNLDGYVKIDGQVRLSHDVGFSDSIALTQAANTTTGANLRLRHLRFFSDNVPTNQAPQTIYATGGDLVISSPSQNIMIDAPQMYWAQDANIYSGGFKLKVGPFNNYIQMADSTSNTVPAYDFVSTLTGGSVGTNYSIRDVLTTTYTANGVDTVAHYLNVVNNTNDAYSGSTTGLSVDVSGGTNTSFPKTAAKFTGGKIWADGYLQQTSGAVSLTANAASQISTTSGNLTVDSAATLKLGAIAATQTNVGRDGYVLTVDAYGHIVTTIAMSPAIAPGAGAGTGGSATITGHDVDGYLTINTGTSTPSASLVATITFANAYGAPPRNILLSPGNQAASDQTASSSAYTPVIGATGGPTITTWTIYSGTIGLSNNTTYIWNYLVIG